MIDEYKHWSETGSDHNKLYKIMNSCAVRLIILQDELCEIEKKTNEELRDDLESFRLNNYKNLLKGDIQGMIFIINKIKKTIYGDKNND